MYEIRTRQNLFIAPSHKDLEKASVYLSANHKAFYKVRHDLQSLKDQPDIVFIDHAGAYSPVMETLLLASDGVIIPCELEPYCADFNWQVTCSCFSRRVARPTIGEIPDFHK